MNSWLHQGTQSTVLYWHHVLQCKFWGHTTYIGFASTTMHPQMHSLYLRVHLIPIISTSYGHIWPHHIPKMKLQWSRTGTWKGASFDNNHANTFACIWHLAYCGEQPQSRGSIRVGRVPQKVISQVVFEGGWYISNRDLSPTENHSLLPQ